MILLMDILVVLVALFARPCSGWCNTTTTFPPDTSIPPCPSGVHHTSNWHQATSFVYRTHNMPRWCPWDNRSCCGTSRCSWDLAHRTGVIIHMQLVLGGSPRRRYQRLGRLKDNAYIPWGHRHPPPIVLCCRGAAEKDRPSQRLCARPNWRSGDPQPPFPIAIGGHQKHQPVVCC